MSYPCLPQCSCNNGPTVVSLLNSPVYDWPTDVLGRLVLAFLGNANSAMRRLLTGTTPWTSSSPVCPRLKGGSRPHCARMLFFRFTVAFKKCCLILSEGSKMSPKKVFYNIKTNIIVGNPISSFLKFKKDVCACCFGPF